MWSILFERGFAANMPLSVATGRFVLGEDAIVLNCVTYTVSELMLPYMIRYDAIDYINVRPRA